MQVGGRKQKYKNAQKQTKRRTNANPQPCMHHCLFRNGPQSLREATCRSHTRTTGEALQSNQREPNPRGPKSGIRRDMRSGKASEGGPINRNLRDIRSIKTSAGGPINGAPQDMSSRDNSAGGPDKRGPRDMSSRNTSAGGPINGIRRKIRTRTIPRGAR